MRQRICSGANELLRDGDRRRGQVSASPLRPPRSAAGICHALPIWRLQPGLQKPIDEISDGSAPPAFFAWNCSRSRNDLQHFIGDLLLSASAAVRLVDGRAFFVFLVVFLFTVDRTTNQVQTPPSCKGVCRISSTSLSHVVQSVLPLAAMAFFRTARQTSHDIRHLSLKVKLSHSLGKLVSATFSVLNLGPLRSYKARSFSNRLFRRGTDLLTVLR